MKWLRKKVADTSGDTSQGILSKPKEIADHVEKLGIVRKINGRPAETERDEDID